MPARDMARSKKTMAESFYLSNMTPQIPGFNRGIWKNAEAGVRKFAGRSEVYVYTGPIYSDVIFYIGDQVAIPSHFYKIIYSLKDKAAFSVIIPNVADRDNYMKYAVSVDEVEKQTGIDFLAFLDDGIEVVVEANREVL